MNFTYHEIMNQPNSWRETIEQVSREWRELTAALQIRPETQFVFFGCGTSYYLAQSAAALFQELTGHFSRAVPASEVLLSCDSVLAKGVPTIAFAISRSGTTSEVLLAAKHLVGHYPNVQVIGVTCHKEQRLSQVGSSTLILSHASEKSIVMTQSFTNMLLGLQLLAANIANRSDLLAELADLPDLLRENIGSFEQFGEFLGRDTTRNYYVFLGLGKYFGLANEANLKLKEMTQVHCEAYNPLEFRHGPISMLTTDACVVLLDGHKGHEYLSDVAADIDRYGVQLATLGPSGGFWDLSSMTSTFSLHLSPDLKDWSRTVLYMPALQFLAYHKSRVLGLNPDEPRNLTQVVVIQSKDDIS